jgi:YD repeat-containing protein
MRRRLFLASTSLAATTCAMMVSAQSSTETYTYDALGRLVRVVTTGGQNNAETQSICYDPAGNRTEYRWSASNGSSLCAPVAYPAPGPSPSPTPTPNPTPTPSPTPTPTPTPTSVQITDAGLNVFPAHQAVYNCFTDDFGGSPLSVCSLNSNGVTIYRSSPSPAFDPGYSMPIPNQLQVTSSAYGTGVAP